MKRKLAIFLSFCSLLALPFVVVAAAYPSVFVGSGPVAGYVLQTNGTASTWVPTSSLGFSGGGGTGTVGTSTALTPGQVTYATGYNTIGSDAGFTYDGAGSFVLGTGITINGGGINLSGGHGISTDGSTAVTSFGHLVLTTATNNLDPSYFSSNGVAQWVNNGDYITGAAGLSGTGNCLFDGGAGAVSANTFPCVSLATVLAQGFTTSDGTGAFPNCAYWLNNSGELSSTGAPCLTTSTVGTYVATLGYSTLATTSAFSPGYLPVVSSSLALTNSIIYQNSIGGIDFNSTSTTSSSVTFGTPIASSLNGNFSLHSIGSSAFQFPGYTVTATSTSGAASTTITVAGTSTAINPNGGYISIGLVAVPEIAQYKSVTTSTASTTYNGITRGLFGTTALAVTTSTAIYPFYPLVYTSSSSLPIIGIVCPNQGAPQCETGFAASPTQSGPTAVAVGGSISATGVGPAASTVFTVCNNATPCSVGKFTTISLQSNNNNIFLFTGGLNTSTQIEAYTGQSIVFASSSGSLYGKFFPTGDFSFNTTTDCGVVCVNGGFTLASASSTVITPSISGAIIGLGCDTATTTVDSSLSSSTTAFITTPQNFPGAGFFWDSYLSASGLITTELCTDVTATPSATAFVVKIIR